MRYLLMISNYFTKYFMISNTHKPRTHLYIQCIFFYIDIGTRISYIREPNPIIDLYYTFKFFLVLTKDYMNHKNINNMRISSVHNIVRESCGFHQMFARNCPGVWFAMPSTVILITAGSSFDTAALLSLLSSYIILIHTL